MIEYSNEDSTMVILGIPQTNKPALSPNASLMIPPSESRLGGVPVWHDKRNDLDIYKSVVCGNCHRQENMVFLCQVFAPTDTDERSLYIFACNTRSCSLTSGGWVVLRNQILSPEKDDEILSRADDMKIDINSEKEPKSTVWNFLDSELEATDDDEDLSSLMGLLSARNDTLKEGLKVQGSIEKEEPLKQKQCSNSKEIFSHPVLKDILPCYCIDDIDDPYMEIDKYTPDDDDEDSESDDDGDFDEDSDHIQELLSSYISAEEDTTVVNMLKNIRGTKDSSNIKASTSGAENSLDESPEDKEDRALDRKLARQDPKSRTELLFQKVVSYGPKQTLRYAYCGKPLWCTLPAPASVSNIPPCELCGQPRVFEMQLMPALLSLCKNAKPSEPKANKVSGSVKASSSKLEAIDENSESQTPMDEGISRPTASQLSDFMESLDDGLDYGVVAIYCCPDGCCPSSAKESKAIYPGCYVDDIGVTWREYVVVQQPPDIQV